METAVLAAQVVLAAVLATAAVGKLLDLPGSRRALTGFGVPERTASIAGTLLPLVELAIATALLPRPSAQWGGVAALVLMLAFIGGISNALARGETPDCHCFGALHSARAGWTALVRNAGLAALAAFVALEGPGPAIPAWVENRTSAELVAVGAGVAAAVLAALALRTWWENRRLRRELTSANEIVAAIPPGLPVGSMAPGFEVPDGSGGTVSLEALLRRGLPVALVFVRAGCGPSEVMLPELERWRETLAERLTIGLVGHGSVRRFDETAGGTLMDVLQADSAFMAEIDELFEVFAAYRLGATPSAVIVSAEGTIASATVDGGPAIEELLRLTVARASAGVVPTLQRPAA